MYIARRFLKKKKKSALALFVVATFSLLFILTRFTGDIVDSSAQWSGPQQILNCSNSMNAATQVLVNSYVFQHTYQKYQLPVVIPDWTNDLCPEVVRFFEKFPAYLADTIFPTSTTHHAMQLVCSMKLARDLAKSIGSPAYLFGGSHLGAVRNGGHIYWDDDSDMMMPYEYRHLFFETCNSDKIESPHKEITFKCIVWPHVIKFSVQSKYSIPTPNPWTYPYVDIFFFNTTDTDWISVTPYGAQARRIEKQQYYPTREYYYSGLYFEGPRLENAQSYGVNECRVMKWNHRLEAWSSNMLPSQVDCCHLSKYFPFKFNESFLIRNGTLHRIPLID